MKMNNSRLLLAVFGNYRQKTLHSFRSFGSVQVLNQCHPPDAYLENPNIDNSLFFTNLPNKRRERKVKTNIQPTPSGTLVIDCKQKKFNHYSGMQYRKLDVIPLASSGWKHRKSRGDYFTILPTQKYSPFLNQEGLPETFEDCGIRKEIIDELKKINVTKPTAIQAKVFEKLLSGENVLMFAECGAGKTLGYVIAMIENVLKWKHKVPISVNTPLGIIVTASRELAIQVLQLTNSISSDLGLQCVALIDGNSKDLLKNPQMGAVDILVCTVTIINKLLKSNIFSTKYCKHVVVDDADSFEVEEKFSQIKKFLSNTRLSYTGLNTPYNERSAQICFVSSVAPSSLQGHLYDLIQNNDVPIVSTPYLHKMLHTVPQCFIRVTNGNLTEELLKIAKSNMKRQIPTLIFSNRNKTCNWASHFLKENGVECVTVNKNDSPTQRLENFRNFELGFINILCSTNLLSLGLHFPKVRHIVSLEFPRFMSDYIHRCGRVGRLGQTTGCLITNFVRGPRDVELVQQIEKAVRTNVPLPSICAPRIFRPTN